jgi:hypothetical protein
MEDIFNVPTQPKKIIKYYIGTQVINNIAYVVCGYSTAYGMQPLDSHICINDDATDEAFTLLGVKNPSIVNEDGTHNYKWDGSEVIETTAGERVAELASLPKPQESQTDQQIKYSIDLDYRLSKLELGV